MYIHVYVYVYMYIWIFTISKSFWGDLIIYNMCVSHPPILHPKFCADLARTAAFPGVPRGLRRGRQRRAGVRARVLPVAFRLADLRVPCHDMEIGTIMKIIGCSYIFTELLIVNSNSKKSMETIIKINGFHGFPDFPAIAAKSEIHSRKIMCKHSRA